MKRTKLPGDSPPLPRGPTTPSSSSYHHHTAISPTVRNDEETESKGIAIRVADWYGTAWDREREERSGEREK